jgi:hypothetical protein
MVRLIDVRFRTILPLALVGLVAATPVFASSGAGKPRIKTTKRDIESMGMDGPLVAYDLKSSDGCNQVFTWNVNTNGGKVVSGDGTCEADSTSTGGGVTQIGVAGGRLAWITNLGGNTESDDDLYTSSLPKPREKHLLSAMRTGDIDQGDLDGGWIVGVFGDGDLLAVSTYATKGGAISNAKLRVIGRSGVKTIARGERAIATIAVGSGRIATAAGDGRVRLWSRGGRLLHTYKVGQGDEAALTQHRLLVFGDKGMRVYDTGPSGRLLSTWKAPSRAYLADAEGDIAVYSIYCGTSDTCGRRVYAARVSTGKTVLLAKTPHDVVGLQIEPAGVVYAYNSAKGGTLVLRPMVRVEAALG